MTELNLHSLSVTVANRRLVNAVSLSLRSGELLVMLGPNGAGKTSLLRAALGLQACSNGRSLLDGRPLAQLPASERARRIAYLPQQRPLAWPSPVRDVVALGRYAHGVPLGGLRGADRAAVDAAIEACDLQSLSQRSCATLSGGELARVHCARALAAQTPLLIADEPVAALDPRHQFRIMDLLRGYVDRGGGALVVLHDLNLAARYADQLLWLHQGRLCAQGTVAETLTPDRLAQIYQIDAEVHWQGPQPQIHIRSAH